LLHRFQQIHFLSAAKDFPRVFNRDLELGHVSYLRATAGMSVDAVSGSSALTSS
jgi:hypothetical protein